jgi:hypothetical protein
MGYAIFTYMKIKNDQLEFSLPAQTICPSTGRRQRRLARASLWFNRMRQVVDEAIDHRPAPAPRDQHWIITS